MNILDRAVSSFLPVVPKPIVRRFSRRYIAGSRMEDAFQVARHLASEGAMTTLDILGEFVNSKEMAEANTVEYLELIDRIAPERLDQTHISVKLTALGLLLDQQFCLNNMRRLLEHALAGGNFVRIDMEDSPCTTPTLAIYRTLREEFPGRVGVVFQSRLRRTIDDVEQLAGAHANYRLCKGIYVEPRAIAYTDAEIIRRNFVLVLERMFEQGAYVGIATHDERLVWEALRLIRRFSLGRERYEFQMLLGVDEPLRRILIDAGHRLRVYVPYGRHWYSYSVRRLRENPQIAGHALRAIFRRA